jgi:hypothetical protein
VIRARTRAKEKIARLPFVFGADKIRRGGQAPMDEKTEYLTNLAERTEEFFSKTEEETIADLERNDKNHAALLRKASELEKKHPIIEKILREGGAVSMTAREHEALLRYLDLKRRIGARERMRMYFRGCEDCFASFKKTDATR